MFYVIGIIRSEKGVTYKLIDTLSESTWMLSQNQLEQILQSPFTEIANAKIVNGNVQIQKWVNNIDTMEPKTAREAGKIEAKKCPFILISENWEDYRITNYNGNIVKVSLKELLTIVNAKEMANCNIINHKGTLIVDWVEKYKIIADAEFEKDIAKKYEIFMAKTNILGNGNNSFKYEIENNQVKLKKYTGSSKNVILPSFITVIMSDAFSEFEIETINLNEGLKIIGAWALAPTNMCKGLEHIEIPSTVELIGRAAFDNNRKMYRANYNHIDMNKVKLRSNKTIIMDSFN